MAICSIVLGAAPAVVCSQKENAEDDEALAKHKFGITFGYTHIPEGAEDEGGDQGVWVFTGGIDYKYRFREPWSVSAVAEIEFGEYLIVDKELGRDNAAIVAGLVVLELFPRWEIFSGVGVEFEKSKNLAVFRVGTEYEFAFGRAWGIAPAAFADITQEYTSYSIAVIFGKWFW